MAAQKKKTCGNCDHWERDGADGICRGGTPRPTIVLAGQQYNIVWPRTRSDERCGGWTPVNLGTGDLQ